jgi:hypothetical protein
MLSEDYEVDVRVTLKPQTAAAALRKFELSEEVGVPEK